MNRAAQSIKKVRTWVAECRLVPPWQSCLPGRRVEMCGNC